MKRKELNYEPTRVIIRYLLLLVVLAMPTASIFAQNEVPISGVVTDWEARPIVGALVTIDNPQKSTMTDMDGKFSIEGNIGTNLTIVYLGCDPLSVTIIKANNNNFVMQESDSSLGEVVVVAYGAQKKESLTGAISSIRTKEITTTKAPSLVQSIQGKVAGLRIRQSDGEPGQFRSDMNIRGLGTPLFIVDGVIRDGVAEFGRLSPDDIESMSFLKDGTAAIYGMNSTNGAIIVTTKKGSKGTPRVSLSSYYGFTKPTEMPEMASALQYMDVLNDAGVNSMLGVPTFTQEQMALWQSGAPGYHSQDFYNMAFRKTAQQHQHNLSIQGGSENISYFGSFGYASEDGLLRSNDLGYDKFSMRSNTNIKISKHLTADINLSGRWEELNQPWASFFDIFKQTRLNPPTKPIYANNNPEYLGEMPWGLNPLGMAEKDISGYQRTHFKDLQTTFALTYNAPFLSGLVFRGQFSYDYNSYKRKALRKKFSTYEYVENDDLYKPIEKQDPSLLQLGDRERNRTVVQLQASYNTTINDQHNIGATMVFERRELKNNGLEGEGIYYAYTIDELEHTTVTKRTTSGRSSSEGYLSYVGRLNYDFRGKYLAEFAFRQDGSYRYAPGHRWAFFPTASVGWRISEEKFIKNNLRFVDNIKLRASFGKSGEDAGQAFQFIPGYSLNGFLYEFTDGNLLQGAAVLNVNPRLTWKKSKLYDIGLDFSIFRGMLAVEFDLYHRQLSGIPAKRLVDLPNTYGATLPEENLNSKQTRGVEFTVSHQNKINDFSYKVSANFNFARTKNGHVEQSNFSSSYDRWKNQKSDRYDDEFIWGYTVDGQFRTVDQIRHAIPQSGNGNRRELPGDYIYNDANGDGFIDEYDQLPIFWGKNPLLNYGFTLEASWKGFDIYALFQGAAKYTLRFKEAYSEVLWSGGANFPDYFHDRWHKADPYDSNSEWVPGKWPASRFITDLGAMYKGETTIWRRNASYLRLKSLELGYTLPKKALKRIGIDNARIYVNGYNLLTFADSFIKQFDPEKVEGAHDTGYNYPLMKSYNIGITVNF